MRVQSNGYGYNVQKSYPHWYQMLTFRNVSGYHKVTNMFVITKFDCIYENYFVLSVSDTNARTDTDGSQYLKSVRFAAYGKRRTTATPTAKVITLNMQ